MAATQEINDTVFKETITRAVQEVFKTMLGKEASLLPPDPQSHGSSLALEAAHVVGTVGFIGSINGLIYLYLEASFAREVAGAMLGMTNDEVDEAGEDVINDAIGELTNMTVGTFKNQLSDKGYPCRLTIPSILRGSNFTIEPISSATRRLYRFNVNGHRLTADLLMQPGD
jgi:chemotaxis protein CheX